MPTSIWTSSTRVTEHHHHMIAHFLRSIHEVNPAEWNALELRGQPFLRHEFLAALEDTGCASEHTGWIPCHLCLRDDAGTLLGAAPLYLKTHSFGEFVFDFSWAEAYSQAGLEYYPKLVNAIPFTPATGPRLLVAKQADRTQVLRALCTALREFIEQNSLSGAHTLFVDEADQEALLCDGWLGRVSCQFQWSRRGHISMDEFFATFRAEKRKKALRERRRVLEQDIRFQTQSGAELSRADWQLIFALSAKTFHEHGHEHYLSIDFFHRVSQALPNQVMVKRAEYQGETVATAIFFHSDTTLFGRYWGTRENFHSLHFETCYYQGIEFCIERGIDLFEPGTQGEHKVARGFEPTLTHSAHLLRDPRLSKAVGHYLHRERMAVEQYASAVREHVPFHRPPT